MAALCPPTVTRDQSFSQSGADEYMQLGTLDDHRTFGSYALSHAEQSSSLQFTSESTVLMPESWNGGTGAGWNLSFAIRPDRTIL